MCTQLCVRSLLAASGIAILVSGVPVTVGDNGAPQVKKAYAAGAAGGGSAGAAASGSSGSASGAAAASGAGSAAAGSSAGSGGGAGASGGAGGGFSYTPELSAVDAFLRSPLATYPVVGQQSTVRVQSAFYDELGRSCRVIEQTVTIAGEPARAQGTVCQQYDGRWALEPAATRLPATPGVAWPALQASRVTPAVAWPALQASRVKSARR